MDLTHEHADGHGERVGENDEPFPRVEPIRRGHIELLPTKIIRLG